MTAAAKKVFEFTTDDDELDDGATTDQGTMCNFYKLNLPANASILSKQIAKSQAKRAEKEKRRNRRNDLSTVREQDETKLSASEDHSTPSPLPKENECPSAPVSNYGGRSRIDSAPNEVKLKRQASLPEERKTEPMDDEECQLLAMLLSGIEGPNQQGLETIWKSSPNNLMDRKFSLPTQNTMPLTNQNFSQHQTLPSPGLPRLLPGAKVSEWLLERSTSPDNLSVGTSVMLEDSGLVLNPNEDDEEDEFFDAEDVDEKKNGNLEGLENELEGLSLNRNMAMTQSLVRVEEETTTDGGGGYELNGRSARSTSVSPRPTNEQFMRNSNGSATFNVKHSNTLNRMTKVNPSPINGNMTTPLSSRTARSVLRVHNVNSVTNTTTQVVHHPVMSRSTLLKTNGTPTSTIGRRGLSMASGIRQPTSMDSTPPQLQTSVNNHTPPTVTINPSTPSRPASVASSVSKLSNGAPRTSNLEGLQDLILMQEEALRRAALDTHETVERKMSWHSDNDANRQSTSTHSSLGSLSSSKSVDGSHPMNKVGGQQVISKIPGPRSRLPTPRGSTLPKRVHSVAAAVRFTTSKSQHAVATNSGEGGAQGDECF